MKTFRGLVLRHFEAAVVLSIFLGVLLMNYLVVQKASFLNFYYLPVLVAGCVLGLRTAFLASALSIGFVTLFATVMPNRLSLGATPFDSVMTLLLWGGFLVLTSYAVGRLYEQNAERVRQLQRAYVGVLEILSRYIEANDRYTLGHSMRVSQLAVEVARTLGLPSERVENCRVGGLLHDIGKLEVSTDLIRKAATLTDEERAAVKTHAQKGARMIDSLGAILQDVVPIIETHHLPYREGERVHEEVPLESSIIAAADAFDAIVTDRPYRAGKPPYQALAEIERAAGGQFHPGVVTALRRVLDSRLEDVDVPAPALTLP
jgi:putative nucleotidyltransferase with HDIG domain